jgi:hypothetical protein
VKESPNPRKCTVLIGNSVFDSRDVFQEPVPGGKRDLCIRRYSVE